MQPLAVSRVSQGANWEPNAVFDDPAKICAFVHGPQTDCGVSHAAVSWHQIARNCLYRPRLGRWSIQRTIDNADRYLRRSKRKSSRE